MSILWNSIKMIFNINYGSLYHKVIWLHLLGEGQTSMLQTSFGCINNGHQMEKEEGFGVIQIETQNEAVLMKNLHKYMVK